MRKLFLFFAMFFIATLSLSGQKLVNAYNVPTSIVVKVDLDTLSGTAIIDSIAIVAGYLHIRISGDVLKTLNLVSADANNLLQDGADGALFIDSTHNHPGTAITSGLVDEAFIDADIARDSELPIISDATYGAAWDGNTTDGASKNALYDKIEAIVAGGADGNGIFDAVNDGGSVPTQYDVLLTDTLRFGATTMTLFGTSNRVTIGGNTNPDGRTLHINGTTEFFSEFPWYDNTGTNIATWSSSATGSNRDVTLFGATYGRWMNSAKNWSFASNGATHATLGEAVFSVKGGTSGTAGIPIQIIGQGGATNQNGGDIDLTPGPGAGTGIDGVVDINGDTDISGTLNTHVIQGGTDTLALKTDLHDTVSLAGSLDYLTLGLNQIITQNAIDLATDITGILADGNIASTIARDSELPIISDAAYGAGWNGNLDGASKNAIYDQIESLPGGHDAVTVSGVPNYITLSGQDIERDSVDLVNHVTGVLPASRIGAHATTHQSGGSDAIKLDDLAAPDDNTDLNVSITAHGLTPKLNNDAGTFLNGTGGWTAPTASAVEFVQSTVYNQTGSVITKGSLVYVNGFKTGNDVPTVALAQADSPSTMPAFGMVNADISNNSEGVVIVSGQVSGLVTNTYSINDPLYVSPSVAGAFTGTKPVADNSIQKIGVVLRSHVSLGVVGIVGAGRSNDIPNFSAADLIWYGGTGGVASTTALTAFARTILDDADAATVRGTIDAAQTSHVHSGADITSGLVDELYIDADIARDSELPVIDDTVYGVSWDANTDGATKNAIYDKIETISADGNGIFSASNDGSTVPTQFDALLTDTLRFGATTMTLFGTSNRVTIGGSTNPHSRTLHINGTTSFGTEFPWYDNTGTNIATWSSSVTATNRDVTVFGATYGRWMNSAKNWSFASNGGTHPTLGAAVFSIDPGTSGTAGIPVVINGQGGATNQNGGDIDLIPGAGAGSGIDGVVDITGAVEISDRIGGNGTSVVGADANGQLVDLTLGTGVTIDAGVLNVDVPGGDVTAGANITDNAIVRGDGGAKGVQESGITIDDSNNVTGMGTLNTHTIPGGTGTIALTTDIPAADGNGMYDGDGTVPTDTDVTVTDSLNIDAGTLYIDALSNEVGIRTVAPTEALEVAGNIKLSGSVDVGNNIVIAGLVDGRDVAADGTLLDSYDTDLPTLSLPANTTITTTGASLIDDASVAAMRTTLGVDAAGTDNSTDVTLLGSLDYITIVGQAITRNAIVLTTDVTGILPAANIGTHASDHITGAGDEIDGDKLNVDWTPTNYTPATTPSEATNVDDLTAHLYGIDQVVVTYENDGETVSSGNIDVDFNSADAGHSPINVSTSGTTPTIDFTNGKRGATYQLTITNYSTTVSPTWASNIKTFVGGTPGSIKGNYAFIVTYDGTNYYIGNFAGF